MSHLLFLSFHQPVNATQNADISNGHI